MLRYVADLDHRSVAAALGTTPTMSRRLVSDALATLSTDPFRYLIVPRVLNALGLGKYQHLFCFARGQKQLAQLWNDHRTRLHS